MVEVLSHLNQYIPTVSTESTVNVRGIEEPVRMTHDDFHTIALGIYSTYIHVVFWRTCIQCTSASDMYML